MLLLKPCLLFFLLFTAVPGICGQFTFSDSKKQVYTGSIKDSLPNDCTKKEEIEKIITDAIDLGAPLYNKGLHIACYRVYEWAGYKILYEYGKSCKDVEKILKAAIEKAHGDYSDTEKAWLMRMAFDKILGVPTKTGETEKDNPLRKG